MGLDVYVGPLTRYYTFEWETIVQQAAKQNDMEVVIQRPPGWVKPDPAEVAENVATWRKRLADAIGVPMRWDESAFGPYETDKPDWDGYHAVRMLALSDEFPEVPKPARIDRRTIESIDREPLERKYGEVYVRRDQSRIGRLLGRRPPEPAAPPKYPHITSPTLWLPVPIDVVGAPAPNGQNVTIGSVERLAEELEGLNDRTFRLDGEALDEARQPGPPDDGGFEPLSRFAFAIFLTLARVARERAQPMILDW